MKYIFAFFFGLFLSISPSIEDFAAPLTYFQEAPQEKPKKEVRITMNSGNYKDSKLPNATTVIEGFFLQANIRDKYIDSSVDKIPIKNFSFTNKTLDEAMQILSLVFNIQFTVKSIGKDKFYLVEPVKKWKKYLVF